MFIVVIGDMAINETVAKQLIKTAGFRKWEIYGYRGENGFNANRLYQNQRCIGIIMGSVAHKLPSVGERSLKELLKQEGFPYTVDLINEKITKQTLKFALTKIKWAYFREQEKYALYTTVGATDGLQYTLSEDGKSYSVTGYIGTNTEITIPDLYQSIPVTIIGESVFYGNYKLKNVSLPNNIIKIESNAFNGCSALIKMVIPNRESISYLHPPISC